ncbi:histidinol-phosphate transaminase [uncultured Roseobacter sp.]|uniref:pyridoxal phosphate-dependent aminotransferase n=1 Tax=uncultured Roseobacter sp. TaxID=114847 RepID=UPI002636288A|nr:histidinol-phosphate transaminase [uncultured Roseobacter sp.]
MIPVQPHVAVMSPYALADTTVPDGIAPVMLAQNESLRPPAPGVMKAVRKILSGAELYPDPEWTLLRDALSHFHGIEKDRILCGSGSLDLITAVARTFSGPGRAVLAPVHAYPFFRTSAAMSGARFDTAPETRSGVSVSNLLQSVRPDTGIVFVANPGNPTGTRISSDALRRLRAGLRPDILLVVDEAYAEFNDHLGERFWDMTDAGNCIVLRSFSKAYGLAGLRVGWGYFPGELANHVRKVLNPNNLALTAQAAAVAALEDREYMRQTCAQTAEIANLWAGKLQSAGFNAVPGCTNFLLLRFDDAAEAIEADNALKKAGIFLRRQNAASLPQVLRWTIAQEPCMQAAFDALIRWQEGERA